MDESVKTSVSEGGERGHAASSPSVLRELGPGPVLLFDGVCNVCNGWVQFVIRRDPTGRVRFASLQSPTGQRVLEALGRPADRLDTMILVEDGQAYLHSTGVLRALRHLRRPWPLLAAFLVIPAVVRDAAYRLVARNRYRLFGRKESCMVPTPETRRRFVE